MQKLILLACLVVTAAAQQHFYCSSDAATTVSSSLADFYLTTRRLNEASYSSGLSCEFNAESSRRAFFVEIKSFKVSSAIFTISSGDQVLFSGSSIQDFQSSIMTPSKSLKVRFESIGDHSNSEGVTIRVRSLDLNGCPPGWTFLNGNCFGTGSTNTLNYVDAQRACNSMRSNLLHVPSSYFGSLGSFMRMLPSSFRSYYTWIGLTDRSVRFQHNWLDGSRQYWTSEISCYSDGSASTCYSYERCGTFNDKNYIYAIYMDDCTDRNRYACSAPPGGTSYFYSVPNTYVPYESTTGVWIWGVVGGSLFVVGLIIVGVYTAVFSSRARARRMAQPRSVLGTTSVVVSTGGVSVPPPGSYPAQPQYPVQQPYTAGSQYPQYSPAPPSYEIVATGGGGQVNSGYAK